MVGEFPFAEETEGAHCEGEDWRDGGGGREKGGGMEDCAVTAECGDQVGFLVEEGWRRDGWGGGRGEGVDWEREVTVEG